MECTYSLDHIFKIEYNIFFTVFFLILLLMFMSGEDNSIVYTINWICSRFLSCVMNRVTNTFGCSIWLFSVNSQYVNIFLYTYEWIYNWTVVKQTIVIHACEFNSVESFRSTRNMSKHCLLFVMVMSFFFLIWTTFKIYFNQMLVLI